MWWPCDVAPGVNQDPDDTDEAESESRGFGDGRGGGCDVREGTQAADSWNPGLLLKTP